MKRPTESINSKVIKQLLDLKKPPLHQNSKINTLHSVLQVKTALLPDSTVYENFIKPTFPSDLQYQYVTYQLTISQIPSQNSSNELWQHHIKQRISQLSKRTNGGSR